MLPYLQLSAAYLFVISSLAIIVAISARLQERRHVVVWAFVVAIFVFLLATFTRLLIVPFNADESRRDFLLTGDEPAYLMTALSVAHDGDFNLANNAANKDYLLFQRKPYVGSGFEFYNSLAKNRLTAKKDQWADSRYMRHRPGTSILLAPAFLLADHNQRFWSYTIISFCFALFCGFSIYYLAQVLAIPLPSVLVVCLVCGLSPPVYFYLNQAYPEIPAGILLTSAAVLFLNQKRPSLIPFVLAAFVIWFSDRIILAALILCAGGFFCLQTNKQKFLAVLILGSSGFLFACYCWHRFGLPYPISHNTIMGFSYDKIPTRILQVLFDARQGWVWLFPPVLLVPAMLWQVVKNKHMTLGHATVFIAFTVILLLVAAFDDWGGGTCPRGRYFVIPQLLFMVLAIIWLKEEQGRMYKLLGLIVLGAVGLMQLFWLAQYPKWWFAGFHPLFSWQEIHVLIFHLPFLPDDAEPREWIKLLKMLPLLCLPSLCFVFLKQKQQNGLPPYQ